jgi:hypothetical protein
MSKSDLILIVSGAVSLCTIIGLFVRLTWFLSEEFKKQRKLMYEIQNGLHTRILRLEFWAVRFGKGTFQPGAEPVELSGEPDKR